jgi:hypothetical protein
VLHRKDTSMYSRVSYLSFALKLVHVLPCNLKVARTAAIYFLEYWERVEEWCVADPVRFLSRSRTSYRYFF